MGNDIVIKDISVEEEQALNKNNNYAVEKAKGVIVNDDSTYKGAAEFLQEIKKAGSIIKSTFKDMKESAYKAHKTVCAKENEFLKPLNEAERIVKDKMRQYIDYIEKQRREEERRLREEQQRRAEEELKKAMELEEQGKAEESAAAMENVSSYENLNPVVADKPKAEGISTQVAYEVLIMDEKKVPAYLNGVELRAVNKSAIKQLAKATKGEIEIPGVKIIKTNNIRVR